MDKISVYKCGTIARPKQSYIDGTITGITIRYNAIAYEFSYFNGDQEYRQVWLNEGEFTALTGSERESIGFR